MSSPTGSHTADFDPSSKPDKNAPRDEQWAYLQKAVAYIMNHPEGIAGLGPAAINIHSVVFDFCHIRKPRAPVVLGRSRPLAPHEIEHETAGPEQLEGRLARFLESHFESVYRGFEAHGGLDLLAHYAAQFDRASASATQLDRVFNHLNRQRLPHNPNPKHIGKYGNTPTKWILSVKATVLDVWRRTILLRLQEDSTKFTSALLDTIHKQQGSDNTEENAALVKKILESLIMLDDHLTNPLGQSTLYQDHFQSRFLSDWEVFCLSKRTELGLSTDEAAAESSAQLKNVLETEMNRMAKYLPEITQKEVKSKAGEIMNDKSIVQ